MSNHHDDDIDTQVQAKIASWNETLNLAQQAYKNLRELGNIGRERLKPLKEDLKKANASWGNFKAKYNENISSLNGNHDQTHQEQILQLFYLENEAQQKFNLFFQNVGDSVTENDLKNFKNYTTRIKGILEYTSFLLNMWTKVVQPLIRKI